MLIDDFGTMPCKRIAAAALSRGLRAVLLAVGLSLTLAAAAVEVEALYTAEVAMNPSNPNAQDQAFRTALSEVLVRVTGSTAIVESEQMATLFPNPARYVSQYRPGPDNTLIVSLEGPAIETALRQAGVPVWGIDRPLTLVWIAVDWGLGDREIVAADDQPRVAGDLAAIDRNRQLREEILQIAAFRGIPVTFPLLDRQDLDSISFSELWGGFDDLLLEASLRYDAESILVGRIRPESDTPARWTWYHAGRRLGLEGDAAAIMHQVADALAAEYALTGREPVDTIRLTISGINSVAAYGRVQQMMENLRGVDAVGIETVAGNRIVYEVQVLGGMERLQRALAGNGMLEQVIATDRPGDGMRPGSSGNGGRSLEFQLRAQ